MKLQDEKKGQATLIAPLQPPTLAFFRTWGSSAGAGRKRLARAKVSISSEQPSDNLHSGYFLQRQFVYIWPKPKIHDFTEYI